MRNYWQTPQGAAQGGQRQPAARGDAPAAAGARGALGDGERELPVGPYGTYDQAGNLFEQPETLISNASLILGGGL